MIRLGLIGLGQAAQILHIPNIEKMENKYEITAVADISKNLTGRASEIHTITRWNDKRPRYHRAAPACKVPVAIPVSHL